MPRPLLPTRLPALLATLLAAPLLAGPLLLSAPAAAHTDLTRTTPDRDAALETAPETIGLTFSDDVAPRLAAVTLRIGATDLGSLRVTPGEAPGELVAAVPVQALPTGPAPATWTVRYRVTSSDGHPVEGAFDFRAPTAPADQRPDAATDPDPAADPAADPAEERESSETAADAGSSTTALVVGGLAVLAVAGALLVRARRSSPR